MNSPTSLATPSSGRTHAQVRFRKAQWRMLLATMFCYLFFYTGRQNFGFAAKAERYRHVLGNPSFLIAAFSIGCESIARYGLLYWVPVRFLGSGWRQNPGSAWITLALPIGMAAGALCAGYISDTVFRGNRTRPIALLLGLDSMVTAALAFVPVSHWGLGAGLLAVAGFLVYGPQAAYWALCPDLLGRERAGTAVGLMDAAAYAFAAGGEVPIGAAVDRTGTTAAVFYVVPVVCLAGALSILKVRETRA